VISCVKTSKLVEAEKGRKALVRPNSVTSQRFGVGRPKKAKFKPKVMDESGELTDHPDPEAVANRSKWQPIVMQTFSFSNSFL